MSSSTTSTTTTCDDEEPKPIPIPIPLSVPLHAPPTKADIFDLTTSGPPPPVKKEDPRVSLRDETPHPSTSSSDASSNQPDHPTLSSIRASEEPAKRLSRLRSLFDSIPIPPPSTTPSPVSSPQASTSTLPVPFDEEKNNEEEERERRRKVYARELWKKCSGTSGGLQPDSLTTAPVASTSTSTSTTSSSNSPPSSNPTSSKSQIRTTAAARWTAFEIYADEKERELWRWFLQLDLDGDMKLKKDEVRQACLKAGIEVKDVTLDSFIREVDKDGDGYIGWEEWRDFLLPLARPMSMSEIFKYYQTHRLHRPSMSQLTQDGDVVVGRGKTGWNKLLGKAAIPPKSTSSTASATTPAALNDPAVNLRKQEADHKNAEREWAEDQRKKGKSKAKAKERQMGDVDGEAGVEAEMMADDTGDDESGGGGGGGEMEGHEDEHHDDHDHEHSHGMFSGAGKFLLAGGVAGAVSRTATAPFDRLKVYLITSPSSHPMPGKEKPPIRNADGTVKKAPRRNAGSIPAAVRAVWKQGGGITAFWTGNGLNVIKIFPESAIKFLSYESAKRVFAQYWDKVPDQTMISNSSRFIAGGIGGVVSQFVIYPIETLKTRVMSSTGGEFSGNALIIRTAQTMYRQGGIKLYFKGLTAGLIGVFPYSAIDMSTFEGIKLAYKKWAGQEPGIPGSLAFGALSGGIGATSVYPLNLVRTRLQAQGTPAHPQTYTGVRDAAMKCFQREGWRGFYKGLTPTLVKVVPAVAISYAVYDASKKVLFGSEDPDVHVEHQDATEE